MDPTRRRYAPYSRGPSGGGRPLRLTIAVAGLALAAACSGLSNNSDGIASLEVRLPTNFFLEDGQSVQLFAVARNADGDSVQANIVWRTSDTTVAVDSATGVITGIVASGTARIQAAILGKEPFATTLGNLNFTLTAPADSMVLTGPDSVDATKDATGANLTGFKLLGGTPPVGVSGRPISFRIVDPVQADSPSVVVGPAARVADSSLTDPNGLLVAVTVRAATGKQAPDRVVVEFVAYRASGALIPGSGRTVVVRFLHQ